MSIEAPTFIPLEDLVPGGIYRIKSRNLAFGVWDPEAMQGTGGFIGIREKFWDRYLFTEYHYDTGGAYGTARAVELVGQLPEDVPVAERLGGSTCSVCGGEVDFDKERPQWERWRHISGVEECGDFSPYGPKQNPGVWDALEAIESAEARRQREAGELWRGNDLHKFLLMSREAYDAEQDEGAFVDADMYFDKQDGAGVCMGVHNFYTDTMVGQVRTR